MNSTVDKLTVFLAVPGTSLGNTARWSKPEDVITFFGKVCRELQNQLGRPVELAIEKERPQAGVIYTTMFKAAYESDVFIADLTGANPNVFLELGVRYALRRGITLLVSQDTIKPPFNVEHLRVIQYANGPDEKAIEKIIAFVAGALGKEDYNDSPVMDVLDLEAIPRSQWITVSGARTRQLLQAAQHSPSPEEAGRLLRQAVEGNPLDVEARLTLARHLRRHGLHQDALNVLEAGIRLDPGQARLWLEQGLTLGRMPGSGTDLLQQAIQALRRAVQLEPADGEALASLGGALRRLALRAASVEERRTGLMESGKHYLAARNLNRHNTYPAFNLVRTGFHLQALGVSELDWDNANLLEKTYHLCAFENLEQPGDYWRALDLADALMFKGQAEACRDRYRRALDLIPWDKRVDVLPSPLSTLMELRDAHALPAPARPIAEAVIPWLQEEILKSTPQREIEHERP